MNDLKEPECLHHANTNANMAKVLSPDDLQDSIP